MKIEYSNDLNGFLAQTISAMKDECGDGFDIDRTSLAKRGRRTYISHRKFGNLKKIGV